VGGTGLDVFEDLGELFEEGAGFFGEGEGGFLGSLALGIKKGYVDGGNGLRESLEERQE
jgi:hypothetical protein